MMRRLLAFGLALIFTLAWVASGVAQNGGYIIRSPGQEPTIVNPNGNGGYIMQTPGQPPTLVNPTPDGGYKVQSLGQPPTLVDPVPGGGFGTQSPRR